VGNGVKMSGLAGYLRHPLVAPYLTERLGDRLESCHCHPKMATGIARGAVADRFLVVGDAYVCRFYKNGLGSAYFSAAVAAKAIIKSDFSKKGLITGYAKPVKKRFSVSNRCGKLLFMLNDITYKHRWMAKTTLEYMLREREKLGEHPVNALMWSLFTGDRSYTLLLRRASNPLLLARLALKYIGSAFKEIGKWLLRGISGR
jgi:flavin-dependent dehydrogenase